MQCCIFSATPIDLIKTLICSFNFMLISVLGFIANIVGMFSTF